jgi:flagellar protein FlaJ
MKNKALVRRIRELFSSEGGIKQFLARRRSKGQATQEIDRQILEKPYLFAYQLTATRIDRLLPIFKDLDVNLNKSELRISFRIYVGLTLFLAALISSIVIVVVPVFSFFILGLPLLSALLFGIGGGMFAGAFSIVALYVYPIYRADKLKRELEDELPFTTGYMSILSSAGVSPEKMFESLSLLSAPLAVSSEAKDIVRDVNLFGLDIISALEKSSKRTPSERFREMLEGVISTIHSGGNLATYLRGKTKDYMKLKRIGLKKYSDTLSILSEIYVTLLLTGPLLLVIMLSVMAMLGGGNLGILSPDLLLNLLAYVGIPLGGIMFLIILDGTSPKW